MKSAKSVTGRGGKDLPVRNRVSVMSFTYLLLLDNRMLLFVNFRRFGGMSVVCYISVCFRYLFHVGFLISIC